MEDYSSQLSVEALVLSDALTFPSMISAIRNVVRPDMFTVREYHDFWAQICQHSADNDPLDLSAVAVYLKGNYKMEIIRVATSSAGVMGSIQHAVALKLRWIKAQTATLGRDLVQLGVDATDPVQILTKVNAFSDMMAGLVTSSAHTIQESVEALGGQLEDVRRKREQGQNTFVPTGFKFLDYHFKGGFRGGNLMVLAARPGVGKTSVMLAMIKAAVSNGEKVRLYSCEMTHTELAEKVMYNLGGLLSREVITGTPDWYGRWAQAKAQLATWGLIIEDKMNNIDDIISDIVISHQRGECSAACLDYLGIIGVTDKRMSIYEATCEKTRKLKQLALAQDIPIIVNAQLNRDSVKENRDPGLQDLRDSGSIEQDADKIVFLSRRKVEENRFQLKMIIGKNRQGSGVGEDTFLNPNETYSEFEETTEVAKSYEEKREEQMKRDLPF